MPTITLFRSTSKSGMWHVRKEERADNHAAPLCITVCECPYKVSETREVSFPEEVKTPSTYHEWKQQYGLHRRGEMCKECSKRLYTSRQPAPAYDPNKYRAAKQWENTEKTVVHAIRSSQRTTDAWRHKHITSAQEDYLVRLGHSRVEVETWTRGKAYDEIQKHKEDRGAQMLAQGGSR